MSESTEDRSPGLNSNLTPKLIFAILFVIVGTGGVGYYIRQCRTCDVAANENPEPTLEKTATVTNSRKQIEFTGGNQTDQDFKQASKKPSIEKSESTLQSSGQSNGFKPSSRITAQRPQTQLPPSRSFGATKQQSEVPKVNRSLNSNGFLPKKIEAVIPGSRNSAPIKNVKQKIDNQIQSLQRKTSNFTDNAKGAFKQAANNLTAKGRKPLEDPADGSFGASRNFSGGGFSGVSQQPNSVAGSQPVRKPSNQSGLPPIAPSSFDKSKGLKPFNAPANPNQRRVNQAPAQARSSQNPMTPPTSATSRFPTGRSNRTSLVSTRPPAVQRTENLSSTLGRATRPKPGDRKLDGIQSPSLTIEKIAPTEIQVGSPADFQIVVKNIGRVAANNVQVVDRIPEGAELVQSLPQPSRGQNRSITWELDTLNPGQEKTINLKLKPLRPGEIGSVAQVTFSALASMRTKVTKPVLSMQHSANPTVLIGDPVVLNIDVKNEGDGAANDVVLQEDLPEGLEFSEGFRELEYSVGTLAPGQSKRVRLELKAARIGKYRNIMVAHAGGGLQTQHAIDVEVVAPQLSASGDGPIRRYLKRQATHRFSVKNNGTAKATNVELICRLPRGLRFVSANNRGKFDENSNSVYWSLAELEKGLVANVELTTVPIAPGSQDLNFEVKSDLNQRANAVCKLNVEHLIDVFFDIDDLVDPIEVGSETQYRLRIVNQGTKTATNVQLQIDFPVGIQPIAVDGNVANQIRGQQIAFSPITSLNPSDEIEIKITGKGTTPGDHRIAVNLMADGREVNVSKQESTRVYSDR